MAGSSARLHNPLISWAEFHFKVPLCLLRHGAAFVLSSGLTQHWPCLVEFEVLWPSFLFVPHCSSCKSMITNAASRCRNMYRTISLSKMLWMMSCRGSVLVSHGDNCGLAHNSHCSCNPWFFGHSLQRCCGGFHSSGALKRSGPGETPKISSQQCPNKQSAPRLPITDGCLKPDKIS